MSHFEGIFVPEPSVSRPTADMARLKLGEVFDNGKNEYAFVCIHCSREFKEFSQFTLHAEEHLACRFKQFISVKEENSPEENLNVTNAESLNQTCSTKQNDESDFMADSDADYFGDSTKFEPADDGDVENDEKFFDPRKSNPDNLASMNGLINSYCSADRTTKNHMNPDEYRPLVAGVDYEKRNGKFTCLRCNKSVSKSSTLRHHLASHRKTKYYSCPLCEKSFIAIENIQKHISRVHKKVYSRSIIREAQTLHKTQFQAFLKQYQEREKIKKQYECYKCKKSVSSLNYLKQHLLCHDQQKEKPPRIEIVRDSKKYRKCVPCDKYYTVNYYREHMLTHNKAHKRFVCEICGAAFLVAPQLRKHMITHERNRRFKCDICPATYTRSPALIKHRRTHPEPLPFACSVCGKGYYSARTLQSHMGKHEIKQIN